ncbi:hypothetical protein ZOSMA_207G00270 [Zostera marina]|uniref:RecA family profile 1 domain-containing protein n=1 Tax=Zostera marina TaxID=29655 RepID=A0A0K9PNH9_ZOSMR|nr:hypothetical protein ZOSMA_207G00270 [Zostera marina]
MSNKLINSMGLSQSISHIFAARNILTAKDALSMTEFDLMMLLDVDLDDVRSAVMQISRVVSPPRQTALQLIEDRGRSDHSLGYLPTMLKGLDETLQGMPFGCLTELVGPAGIGKTQFCLKLSLIAALPASAGGLNGHVVYIDTESKFSSRRLIEIGENSFPHIFRVKGMAKEMAGKIYVIHPTTADELIESLQQIKLSLLQHEVKLVVIDSIAALTLRETETNKIGYKQQTLGCPVSYLKSLAELSQVPIVVTNQVRSTRTDDSSFRYTFEGKKFDRPLRKV